MYFLRSDQAIDFQSLEEDVGAILVKAAEVLYTNGCVVELFACLLVFRLLVAAFNWVQVYFLPDCECL